jgi:hypothetical protein
LLTFYHNLQADPRDVANEGHVYFVGNGDCYSHVDYYNHLKNAKVDSVMVARGALIKPWIFEEIEKGQYLDKSASERLSYVEKFAKYGLQTWGSDELGIGTTRRFLLEWLSFSHRYVPIGLLEHLPPNIQDRPPRFKGRDDLETLLASENYKDWIKIRCVQHALVTAQTILIGLVTCSWARPLMASSLNQSTSQTPTRWRLRVENLQNIQSLSLSDQSIPNAYAPSGKSYPRGLNTPNEWNTYMQRQLHLAPPQKQYEIM